MRSLGLLLAVCAACGSPSKDAPRPSGEAAAPEQAAIADEAPEAAVATPAPQARRLSRDLIKEAGRAELRVGGLFIDAGTVDQHKYSRGGWMSGWGRNALDGETTVARIDGRSAFLDVVLERPAAEVVVRAKGRGSLGLAVGKGGTKKNSLSGEYAVHRYALGKSLPAGRHRIALQGRGAQVDWLWFAETAGQEPPVAEQTTGATLALPAAGSYEFYLIPEAASQLEVATAASSAVQVIAEQDGKAPVVLASSTVETSKPIDLAAFAGSPVRLRFAADGPTQFTRIALTKAAPKASKRQAKPKNVIVLLIDTQRADSFSVVGQSIGAKAYESLIPTSATFRNAYNNENWTKPSIATIDTGLYPDTHGARWRKDRCSKDLVFLSEHLKEQGFATAAMVSNISAGPKFGFNQGWDSFEKTDNAAHAFGRASAWIRERKNDKPFFLYVQTIDPHVPFSVPEGSAEKLFGGSYTGKLGPTFEQSEEDALNEGKLKLTETDSRWLQALYDAEVLYHDEHLGTFLTTLESEGTLADTAFVILNDHGEEFGEHGRWGHGWTVGDVLYRSPLLMHFPGLFPEQTFDEVVEHVDVAPTIVDALGLPAMSAAQGQSLLPLLRSEAPQTGPHSALLYGRPKQRAIRVGDFKLMLQANRSQALYNMKAEPAQKTDVQAKHPIAMRLCEIALGEAVANPRKSERLQDRSELLTIRAEYIDE
tara:strand:- start:16241 stop:18364 length:2124 start_codon:yes stop_codon:yes gene_type:complete